MNKVFKGLVALAFALNAGNAVAENIKGECLSENRVRSVASQIPQHFQEVKPGVYLIETVPESKQGYTQGGRLTVDMRNMHDFGDQARMSIFDRTDKNPKKWYNVSNGRDEQVGCVERGVVYFYNDNGESKDEAQEKFNAAIGRIEDLMK